MDSDIVLVAITDIDTSKALEKVLTAKKYTVLIANPDQGIINLISDKKPSILVLDTNINDNSSGVDLAVKIKNTFDLPIVLLSDSFEEKIFEQTRLINPTAFFSKPFNLNNVIRAIELGIANHRLHKEIEDFKNKYELIIKAANAGVYEIDPVTSEVEADELLAEVYGYTKSEVKELGWKNLMPIEDFNNRKELLSDLLLGKISSYRIEHRVIKKDGTIAWAVSTGFVSTDSHGKKKIIGTLTDISERKEAEEKLKKYSDELKQRNAAKDKFFSIISHDLRNPFNSLLGFSDLLANNIEDLTQQEIKESAQSINRTANHLFYLLTNLLEWSRLQTGNFVMEKADFSLNLIIDHILDIYSISISEKKLNIIKETECEINLFADIHMVESAVRNIISNAIKYSNIGGTVKIGCRIVDGRAEIYVEDNGVGITIEDQARLFKIDKQFSTEGTNFEKGTGFGLLLTKELVERNDGTVYLNSQIGKGTTVIITFPLEKNSA